MQAPLRLATATVATNTILLPANGMATTTPVQARAQTGGTLPSPLASATTYYWIALSSETGRLSATSGGAAITLATAGTSPWGIYLLPDAAIDDAIEAASRLVDAHCCSHGGADDYLIRQATARIAVAEIARRLAREYRWTLEAIQTALDAERDTFALLRKLEVQSSRDNAPNQPSRAVLYGGSTSRGWGGSVP